MALGYSEPLPRLDAGVRLSEGSGNGATGVCTCRHVEPGTSGVCPAEGPRRSLAVANVFSHLRQTEMANLSLAPCSIHREGMNARVTPCTPPRGLVRGFLEAGGQAPWCRLPSAQWWGRPAHQPVPLSSTPHSARDNGLFSTLVTPLFTGQVGAERPRDARREVCPLPSLFLVSFLGDVAIWWFAVVGIQ